MFSESAKHQNAEKYRKHPILEYKVKRNRPALRKTCILTSHNDSYQNVKMHANYPISGNESTLQETCFINAFEILRYQNSKILD